MGKGKSTEKMNKNIKNIYVHKINSLMKMSRESLAEDEMDIVVNPKGSDKKIKKAYSELDKTALKLEKNRESARKARQRKNFYIKLLENQVVALKKQLTQSESVMNLSKKHLSTLMALKSEQTGGAELEDDLDKYISQENLADVHEEKQRKEERIKRLEELGNEFRIWFLPEQFKKIVNLKKQERIELNSKIAKFYAQEEENNVNVYGKLDDNHIRLLLPFEEKDVNTKVINILKNFGKRSDEMNSLLENISEITKEMSEIISENEVNDMDSSQVTENKIKTLITEIGVNYLGDRIDRTIERVRRWRELPSPNMLEAMHKIVEINNFIEKNQKGLDRMQEEDSSISEEKEEEEEINE